MKTWFAAFVFVFVFSPLLFCESRKTRLEDWRAKTVPVFTPHPDDDAFGAG